MKVTLQQIAEASRVSVSTASRALSGHPGINERTAKRVRQAAEDLNYSQRATGAPASSLLGQDVGILCLGMGNTLTSLPTVSAAIGGAETALAAVGARAIFSSIPDLESPPPGLLSRLSDSLILVGAMQGEVLQKAPPEFLEAVEARAKIWLLGRPTGATGDVVGSDDFEVGAIAARTLMEAGHTRLAFVNPKPDHLLFQRREDGFRSVARRNGAVSVDSLSRFFDEELSYPLQVPKSVEAIIDEMLEIPEDSRPTGLFAAADSVAVLIYRALAMRGLSVGKDFSLISGNNDVALIEGLYPSLTTTDVDAFAIGEQAVRQLEVRLSSGGEMPVVNITLPPRLREGQSIVQL